MAGLLAERGISCDLDVWGHDSAHDWSWWQRQIAHHLPRFC
jgi:esterase/lipase superfamily enzyme